MALSIPARLLRRHVVRLRAADRLFGVFPGVAVTCVGPNAEIERESFCQASDPGLVAIRSPARHRTLHGLQRFLVDRPMDDVRPFSLANLAVRREILKSDQGIDERIRLSQAVSGKNNADGSHFWAERSSLPVSAGSFRGLPRGRRVCSSPSLRVTFDCQIAYRFSLYFFQTPSLPIGQLNPHRRRGSIEMAMNVRGLKPMPRSVGFSPCGDFALVFVPPRYSILSHRVSKPKSISEPSPDPAVEREAADPLGLGRTERSKRLAGRPIVAIVAALVVVVLAIGVLVWLWQLKGRSALGQSTGAVVEPDADPAVIAPPAKNLIKPPRNELPIRVPLEKTLEALVQAAAAISDPPETLATNERVQRWEIRFPTGNTPETYARQLDALGIELGVIGGGERISYASAFTKEQPQRREGSATDEQRFYMTWRSGASRDLDNALLSRAKIQTTDRIIAQFYPAQLEGTLADLEKQFAAPRNVADVRHTVFALHRGRQELCFPRGRAGIYERRTKERRRQGRKTAAGRRPTAAMTGRGTTTLTAEELIDTLERRAMLPAETIGSLRKFVAKSLKIVTPESLAALLVERGRLTAPQAKQLLERSAARPAAPAADELSLVPMDDPASRKQAKTDARKAADAAVQAAPARANITKLPPSAKPTAAAKGATSVAATKSAKPASKSHAADPGASMTGAGPLDDLFGPDPDDALAGIEPNPLGTSTHQRTRIPKWIWMAGVGGTALVVFVVALLLVLSRSNGDAEWQLAEKDFAAGSDQDAIAKLDAFLVRFPDHPRSSAANVDLNMARLRQAAATKTEWDRALAIARESLPKIVDQPDFAKSREGLSKLLPEMAVALGKRTKNADKVPLELRRRQVEAAVEALALAKNPRYTPDSQKPWAALQAVEIEVARAARSVDRQTELERASGEIRSAIAADKVAAGFARRDQLLGGYPELRPDDAIETLDQELAQAEAKSLKIDSARRRAETKQQPSSIVSTAVIAASNDKLSANAARATPPAASDGPAAAVFVQGTAYWIDSANGSPLVRRVFGV